MISLRRQINNLPSDEYGYVYEQNSFGLESEGMLSPIRFQRERAIDSHHSVPILGNSDGRDRLTDRRSNMKTAEKIMKMKAVIKAEIPNRNVQVYSSKFKTVR